MSPPYSAQNGSPQLDAAKARLAPIDQMPLQQHHFAEALRALSPMLAADVYSFGSRSPAGCGGGLSPAWSVSSASNNGDGSASAPPGPLSVTHSPYADAAGRHSSALLGCAVHEAMFPALAPTALDAATSAIADALLAGDGACSVVGDTVGAPVGTATHAPSVPATADAALDGWLQQFVNAEAIDCAGARRSCAPDMYLEAMPAPGGSLDALCPGSLAATAASAPGLLAATPADGSPARSPSAAYMGLFDESTVAAIASAVSSTLSPDMLASVLSSASGFCAPLAAAAPSASEIGMLAALPFVGITPTANIAPQKTLSMAAYATPELAPLELAVASPPPPHKRQRLQQRQQQSHAPRNPRASGANAGQGLTPADGNVTQFSADYSPSSSRKAEGPSGGETAGATVLRVSATRQSASSASPPPGRPANSRAQPSRPIAPSPPHNAGATGRMVPLAPRNPPAGSDGRAQQKPPPPPPQVKAAKQQKQGADATKSASSNTSRSTSSSGNTTPPRLSVLAKIAQRQVPISVKTEEPQPGSSTSPQQLRPLAQAHSPNARALQKQRQPATTLSTATKAGSPPPPPRAMDTSVTPQSRQQGSASPADCVTQKRQERLIKNRAAALLSRKRKREYMTKLESEVEELRETNSSLARRLEKMEQQLHLLAAERDMLRRTSGHTASAAAATGSSGAAATGADSTSSGDAGSTSVDNANASAEGEAPEGGSSGDQEDSHQQPQSLASNAAAEGLFDGPPDSMEEDIASDSSAVSPAEVDTGDEESQESDIDEPGVQVRVMPPADAPKANEQSGASKQRSAGVLLMAMLFSFSLFTLPSLYAPGSQIAAGGSQSAGLLPTAAPPATQPRLLISERGADDEYPLVERVRRTISALAQGADDGQAAAPPPSGHNNTAGSRLRPMTMEESASLHSWIRRGLASGPGPGPALAAADASSANEVARDRVRRLGGAAVPLPRELDAGAACTEPQTSSLSVVPQHAPRAGQPSYAMLYCPTMKHVLFGGDAHGVAEMGGGAERGQPQPVVARVLGEAKRSAAGAGGSANDVDDIAYAGEESARGAWSSPMVERPAADASLDVADLAPTHADSRRAVHRPKLSFYSPVAAGDGSGEGPEALPPWEEQARLSTSLSSSSSSSPLAGVGSRMSGTGYDGKQKYLRIDVEVVGSKWVTADKFASGLMY